ncbi:MAG: hypothetical protein QOJ99_1222 [Bryobacterales bacterium]|nr:hypothetical protein [Bryobacterales bacterium]
MQRIKLSGPGTYCRRKLDLLGIFSVRTDQLSVAAVHYARLAGNTTEVEGLARTKQEYEHEKAETQEAYQAYFYHCQEHGC